MAVHLQSESESASQNPKGHRRDEGRECMHLLGACAAAKGADGFFTKNTAKPDSIDAFLTDFIFQKN